MALTKAKLMELIDNGDIDVGGGGLSPNIFHNWGFRNPVNQRGVSGTISAAGYFFDRWLLNSGSVTIASGYLTIASSAEIEQRIEGLYLAGETVTVSAKVGTSYISGSGTFPTSAGTASITLTGFGTAALGYNAGYMFVRFTASGSQNVVSVKCELGTVSTLAYDPPMDYGTELLVCQRFLVNLGTYAFWNGYAISSTVGVGYITVPVSMRINPTLSTTAFPLLINGSNFAVTITSVTSAASRLDLVFSGAGMPINISSIGTSGAAKLLASADL